MTNHHPLPELLPITPWGRRNDVSHYDTLTEIVDAKGNTVAQAGSGEIAKLICDAINTNHTRTQPVSAECDCYAQKIMGLEVDLDSALDIIYRRGDDEARIWLSLNYPKFKCEEKIDDLRNQVSKKTSTLLQKNNAIMDAISLLKNDEHGDCHDKVISILERVYDV